MNMAEERTIREFFNQEAPALKIPFDFFTSPSTNTLLQMYHFMCDLIFEIGERECLDSNGQPSRAAYVNTVYQLLAGLFGDILNNEAIFTYKDMLLPDLSRTRYFLVQLIRFYKFKCERQPEVDAAISEFEERQRDVETEKAFERNISDQLERELEDYDKLGEKKNEVDSRFAVVEREFRNLKEIAEFQKEEYKKQDMGDKELEEKMGSLTQTVNDAHDKLRRLESDIVTSPDRLTAELNSMESELRSTNAKHTEAARELQRLERELSDQALSLQFLEQCDDELAELSAKKNDLTEHRRVGNDVQHAAKEVESKVHATQQKMADQRARHEAHLRKLGDELGAARQRVEMVRQEMADLSTDLQSLVNLQNGSTKEFRHMQSEIKRRNAEVVRLGDSFEATVDKIKNYIDLIGKKADEEEQILKAIYQKAGGLSDFKSDQ